MTFWQKYQFPVLTFICSRIAIFLLAGVFIGIFPAKSHPAFLEAFSQWDGQWYLEIVNHGYWYKGPSVQSPVAFFPLFPVLGKLVTFVGLSPTLSLFVVANLSSFGFFLLFWHWAKNHFTEEIADKAVLLYALSPLSYLFSSLYADSLFLFLVCLVFVLIDQKKYLLSALVVCLASANRPFGVLIALPLFVVVLKDTKKLSKALLLGFVSSIGFFAYILYLYNKFQVIAPFFTVNKHAWHQIIFPPWIALKIMVESLVTIPQQHPFYTVAIFDLTIVLLFFFLLIYSWRELGPIYKLLVIPMFLLSICQLWSPRFFLPSGSVSRHLFQIIFLVPFLAKLTLKNRFFDLAVSFFFISLNGVFALAFFHGIWVQ